MRRLVHRLRSRDAGYNLVILAMAITVMNILVASALPVWSHLIQREKEEELIFRGLQYAEAIRVFQQRFGRPPQRLEELVEVEPRSIRQLWRNPMSDDGRWGLILGNLPATGRQVGQQLNRQQSSADGRQRRARQGRPAPGQQPGTGPVPRGPERWPGDDSFTRSSQATAVSGPIQGVYSLEGGEAVKIFMGSDSVSDWRFTPDLLLGTVVQGGPANAPTPVNAAMVGRPFPPGVVPPVRSVGANPAPTTSQRGTQRGGRRPAARNQ